MTAVTKTPIFHVPSESGGSTPGDSRFDIVIIGTGLAGYTLARELRKLSDSPSLLLVSRDDGAYYSKPMLSNGLAKNKSAADLAAQDAQAMSNNLNATIVSFAEIDRVDTKGRTIGCGELSFGFGKLAIATGAQQINLSIEGDGAADVITVNDLEDYALFREHLANIDRVAVMGPGLIGCEFANDLASIEKTTAIIGPDVYPLERLLPPSIGAEIKNALSGLGVEWFLETTVVRIDKSGDGYRLQLGSGEEVSAGLVLSAAGLVPDLTLARLCQLETGRGILVNLQMQTSQSDIYALGDCIEIEGMILPYVAPITHASKALAHNLLQTDSKTMKDVSYPGMPVVIKTPAYPLVVASPNPATSGTWTVEETETGVRALFHSDNGELSGFVLGGGAVKEKAKLGRELPALIPDRNIT